MTKADFASLRDQVRILALNIGLRPAARAMGLSEDRVRNWSSRNKWGLSKLPLCSVPSRNSTPSDTTAIEATQRILDHHSARTKLSLALAGTNVAEHMAELEAPRLITPATSIAAQQWGKVADTVHGWTQARAQGVSVQVAVINPPSEAERSERRAVHAQLDAITRLLSAPKAP